MPYFNMHIVIWNIILQASGENCHFCPRRVTLIKSTLSSKRSSQPKYLLCIRTRVRHSGWIFSHYYFFFIASKQLSCHLLLTSCFSFDLSIFFNTCFPNSSTCPTFCTSKHLSNDKPTKKKWSNINYKALCLCGNPKCSSAMTAVPTV